MIPPGNLWEATAQETFAAPALTGAFDADIAIVGGGFTGCAAALTAAEQGASVVLLEAARIGHGGSGRNVGLVNAGLWLPPDTVAARLGTEAGSRLNTALGQGPQRVFDLIARHGISCEPVQNCTLHCAHSARAMRALEQRHRQWQRRGAPVALLDATEARERTGSPAVHGALCDGRAGTIQPLAYARGLARRAQEAGALVRENSPVTRIERRKDRWRLATPKGQVTASRVLLATNAYHLPIAGAARARTSIVNFFQAATEPIDAPDVLPAGEGCWDTALIMTSFRRDASGRLILGAMGLPDRGGGPHLSWLERKLARLFPQLADQKFTGHWSGRIAMTESHLPQVVQSAPGLFAIFGYSGRGIAPGTVMGCALGGAMATGDYANLPLQIAGKYHESFCGLRSVFYEAGARFLHLADR